MKMKKVVLYSLFTALLASFINFIFFHELWFNLNSTFFAAGGDGLKAYFGAVYHALYDQELMILNGMNHPYGEHVLYTGNQWFINQPLKMLGLENYVIGTMNFFMLISSIISSIVIFLIFQDLKVNRAISLIGALGISYTSPQLLRMVGHFSLSYSFLLPLIILFAMRYCSAPGWKNSFYIGLTLFICLIVHPYFFVMALVILAIAGAIHLFSSGRDFKILYQMPLQIILPFAMYRLLMSASSVIDRTQFPWGFKEYQSKLSGIFYPFNKTYDSLFRWINPSPCNWEGVSYVGLVFYLAIVVFIIFRLILKQEPLKGLLSSKFNKFSLLSALAGILLSTGAILNYLIDHFAHLLSLFTQIRAIGRFAWIAFYCLNISAVVYLYRFFEKKKYLYKSVVFPGLLVLLFCLDGISPLLKLSDRLRSEIPGFVDPNKKDESNAWLKEINLNNYQAVLTLPLFHVGSENIYKSSSLDLASWQVSISTGLPLIGVELSRTSLSQTHKSMALVKAPFEKLSYLADLRSKKDFLVIYRENELDENEQFLLNNVKELGEGVGFKYGRVSLHNLEMLHHQYVEKIDLKYQQDTLAIELTSLNKRVNSTGHYFEPFSQKANGFNSKTTGLFPSRSYSLFFDSKEILISGNYTFSFWMNAWNEDVKPRTSIAVAKYYEDGTVNEIYFQVQRIYIGVNNTWALVESEIALDKPCRLEFKIWNRDLPRPYNIEVDNFLLRTSDQNVRYRDEEIAFYNNRIVNIN